MLLNHDYSSRKRLGLTTVRSSGSDSTHPTVLIQSTNSTASFRASMLARLSGKGKL